MAFILNIKWRYLANLHSMNMDGKTFTDTISAITLRWKTSDCLLRSRRIWPWRTCPLQRQLAIPLRAAVMGGDQRITPASARLEYAQATGPSIRSSILPMTIFR